ncbi:nucleoid-associated protein Lsr2 [Mycobacterium sp. CBMA 234]|uniref:histone-like nucleoid-structuring protein Lsr2 n=1 Tax=Mycolicibacterium sp. CBMA 234 TaxID=1918495 RepID=UPI0012DFA18F|nr:Lsr2 family protein [Mycolicibacterium sp. CBMA 234]MUL63761.1 nucleoid-associated protein Lsr2 [Mycolicibacterium sp. CBMA 234]
MVRKTIVTLVDDVDETAPADETVQFGLDGIGYEIDLTADNAQALRSQMIRWVTRARRVTQKSSSGSRGQHVGIRAWAQQNGHAVGTRGRIPAEVQRAFDAAH